MTFLLHTLGCKVNQYDGGGLAAILTERGHTDVTQVPSAVPDAVIVNTCAVTEEAVRKSAQAFRRLAGRYPDAVPVLCGCAAEILAEKLTQGGAADSYHPQNIIIGTVSDKRALADRIEAAFAPPVQRKPSFFAENTGVNTSTFELLPAYTEHARAYLKIQDGCDNFCAYCVIPYIRGRVRSVSAEDAVAQTQELARRGFREIVITGVEIASYGRGTEVSLPELLRILDGAAGPEVRFHLSSIAPDRITPELVGALAGMQNVCPHFHLSVQSGSSSVLARMRRHYGAEGIRAACASLRAAFPGCSLTADFIAGFPGETNAEYIETLGTVQDCGFSGLHVFPYSKRGGTSAADMPGQVPENIKKERAKELRALGVQLRRQYLQEQVGRRLNVLIERDNSGHSENYLEVLVEGADVHRGEIAGVLVSEVRGGCLVGRVSV
ncbi:MAG: tRNA (N(6)-L-threonylcarbamoyladenosine(37)-C(2))-methylthiotransferase MtaB [Oscillospiraceae bacterium]|jgi:threonylcarbamoyladenosine tRNA methylthiotransferase MtaB|nr:tRNA (N(6)-L-threonylcarbamoyladenosine(37)-C(2))-methylthiotransferase MtaB [Oscillospiraceae bacterium]